MLARATAANPALLAVKGVGPVIGAQLLITAGDNPARLHSSASFAALCGTAPIPVGEGDGEGDQGWFPWSIVAVRWPLRWHSSVTIYSVLSAAWWVGKWALTVTAAGSGVVGFEVVLSSGRT